MFNFIKDLFKVDYSKYQKLNFSNESRFFINLEQILDEKVLIYATTRESLIEDAFNYLNTNYPDMINAFSQVDGLDEKKKVFKESLGIFVEELKL
jgi:hypothetical protein